MKHATEIITDIVLDFDGTCTQIPGVYDNYLEEYRRIFNETVEPLSTDEWKTVQQQVYNNSPKGGWMISGWPTAPAASDPYILAYESANLFLTERKSKNLLPPYIHQLAYTANPAPWRGDALDTLIKLIEKNIGIHFISNSSTKKITARLEQLFGAGNPYLKKIKVESGAAKFRICEIPWEKQGIIPAVIKADFDRLPGIFSNPLLYDLERPVYLRRGAYFGAIYNVFKTHWSELASTVFCGDIWEMDLAMPYALGAKVHLLERAAPFNTYDYERQAVSTYGDRAKISTDLSALLSWI